MGVPLSGVYWCPHHPDGVVARYAVQCDCRKPLPGLLRRAAGEHDIDMTASWMVGDILHDVEGGRRAWASNCRKWERGWNSCAGDCSRIDLINENAPVITGAVSCVLPAYAGADQFRICSSR